LLPSGPQAGHPGPAQLAAWTVAEQANGDIKVTIRELRHPAGLQATLRADGLPAAVSFSVSGPPVHPSCQAYPADKPLLGRVFRIHPRHRGVRLLIIDPAALPSGAGVSIFDLPHPPPPPPGVKLHRYLRTPVIGVGLVKASQQCTGS
jgi:hypothetical protein